MKHAVRWTGIVLLGAGSLACANTDVVSTSAADNDLDSLIDSAVLVPEDRDCRELETDPEKLLRCEKSRETTTDISTGIRNDIGTDKALEGALANKGNLQPADDTDAVRSTFRSFRLSQLGTGDLDSIGLGGLRPISNPDQRPRIEVSTDDLFGRVLNPSVRDINDNSSIILKRAGFEGLIANTILFLENDGYARIAVDVKRADGGMDLVVSTEVRATIGIVDDDGLSNTPLAGRGFDPAGALVVGPFKVNAENLQIGLRGVPNGDRIVSTVYAPNGITVDMTGTKLGVADAIAGTNSFGTSTTFFAIDGILRIAPGMTLRAELAAPDANNALITLNSNIGDISLSGLRLIDNNSGGEVSIGQVGVSGINLVNTRVLFENDTIVLETGTGLTNVGVSLERIAFGSTAAGYLGDVYVNNANIGNATIRIREH